MLEIASRLKENKKTVLACAVALGLGYLPAKVTQLVAPPEGHNHSAWFGITLHADCDGCGNMLGNFVDMRARAVMLAPVASSNPTSSPPASSSAPVSTQ